MELHDGKDFGSNINKQIIVIIMALTQKDI